MPVKVKRKELEKIGITVPRRPFTKYYLSMLLLSDDIEITEFRFGKTIVRTYKKNDSFYKELKELYFSKL